MTVDVPHSVIDTKKLKSKKSKKLAEDSHGTTSEEKPKKSKKHRQDLGDSEAPGTSSQKQKQKRMAEAEDVPVVEGTVDETMAVDTPSDENDSKAEKKKKRKRDEEAILTTSESKKDKKKRKKESLSEATPSSTEAPADEPSSSKDKKDKKKKKKQSEVEATIKSTPSAPVATTSRTSIAAPSASEADAFLAQHSITIHGTTPLTPILSFDQLDVPADLRAACNGFKEPTPIQACSWPAALAGQDVVGIAETGSGKTMAFGLPALARILSLSIPAPSKGASTVSILVVAPTRELAIQTHDTLSELGEPFGIASVAVFGGVDKRGQIDALRNIANGKGKNGNKVITRIVVGTPGRLLDLVNDGVCDLSNVRYLVLDEADRMLDKGFENDIREIIGHTKQGEERQTLMFSATWPDSVRRLAATFQREPVRVTVGSDDLTANSRVEQVVEVFDDQRSKDSRLLGHLRTLVPKKKAGAEETRILIFALYKKEATRVEGMLRSKGFSVGGLHGDLSQSARMEALHNFKTGTTGLLVATDVAARGLDIPNVAAVINYTFPLTIEDYIHRIGRTGRGGKSGKSITFFTGDGHERALAGELARVLRESGFEAPGLNKFPMTIKKKEHSVYGAFFRDDIPIPTGPTKIKFD